MIATPPRIRFAPVTTFLLLLFSFSHLFAQNAIQNEVDHLKRLGVKSEKQALFLPYTEGSDIKLETYGIEKSTLSNATVLFPDKSNLRNMLDNKPAFIELELPALEGELFQLQLFRKSPLSSDFLAVNDLGRKSELPVEAVFYRGVIVGHEKSLAMLSIFEGELRGSFAVNGHNYVLGKIDKTTDGAHILYRTDGLTFPDDFSCQVIDDHDDMDQKLQSSTEIQTAAKTLKCVRLRVEVDHGLVNTLGGESAAITHVLGMFNEVSTLFANDDIDIVVSEIFAWVGSSPYTGSLSNRLFQVSNTSPDSDLTALITNVGGGGIAFLSAVCSANFGVSVSSIYGFYQNVPTYSWDVNVCAHEIGHNLSAPHTHACSWNGNNTPLDGCGIQAGYSEGNCGTAPIPAGGGSMMSYCHLIGGVGITFANGFGAQPATRMINYINTRACLGSTCATSDGPVCTEESLTLKLIFDQNPGQTSWNVTNSTGAIVAQGGNYASKTPGSQLIEKLCLPEACYTLNVFDSQNNGMCCSSGSGSYQLLNVNDELLVSGSAFGSVESSAFCTGALVNAPCEKPYPQVTGLTSTVQSNGVLLSWNPIPGTIGCQIRGGLVAQGGLVLMQNLQANMSQYFIPESQLPVSGNYRVRVRCGCAFNPTTASQWTTFNVFQWNNTGAIVESDSLTFATVEAFSVDAFPNPTRGELNLNLRSNEDESFSFRLYDMVGKLIFTERRQHLAGTNTLRFDFSSLGEGLYILQTEGSNGVQVTHRVMIVK